MKLEHQILPQYHHSDEQLRGGGASAIASLLLLLFLYGFYSLLSSVVSIGGAAITSPSDAPVWALPAFSAALAAALGLGLYFGRASAPRLLGTVEVILGIAIGSTAALSASPGEVAILLGSAAVGVADGLASVKRAA